MSRTQKAGLVAAVLAAMMLGKGFGVAQEAAPEATDVTSAADEGVEAETSGLLDEVTMDAMTSPIALYPDTLLGQVLVATTYPLDVMQADRFLLKNAGMTEDERTAAVNDQDWPDSVKSLAAGFPELINRMAEHSDWTELMGAALIVQTDDVLASIQRLRAQAKVNGYLEDNAAMTVETDPESEAITISSADPNVVYVPEYSNVVYTQPAPGTPYYVYDNDNDNLDWGDALVGGAIIWGTAVIIDNIFDDDWGNGWDNGYWHGNGGGNSIDWDGDINIDNGINIGNGNIGSGNRPEIGSGNTIIGGDKFTGIDKSKITDIDRTKIGDIDRSKVADVDLGSVADRSQIGAMDQDRLDRARDANFNPTAADRDAARAKIAAKEASGKGVATLPAAKGVTNGTRDYAPAPTTKLATKPASKPSAKPATTKPAKATTAAKPSTKVSKPKTSSKPPSKPRPAAKAPVYEPHGGSRAGAAAARGNSSRGRR